jgi:ubiquinol-cytochrome c reductase cytochrome c subunit
MTSDTPAGRRFRVFGRRRSAPSRARRRLGAAVRMAAALALAGGVYTAFTPGAYAEDDRTLSAAAQEGQALFNNSCITCHGVNAQGVEGRGPSLIGVGGASVQFQVGTGRMPMARQEAQAWEKPPQFDEAQTAQLAQYIQELGGGPQLPSGELVEDIEQNPEAMARGGELFRINCTACHQFGGAGGALSSGKYAPGLRDASPEVIYAAMLSGPQNMPRFSERQLSPEEKKDIIAYVKSVGGGYNNNPGGNPLGGIGPVSEGLIAFIAGLTAMIGFAMWLGAKN